MDVDRRLLPGLALGDGAERLADDVAEAAAEGASRAASSARRMRWLGSRTRMGVRMASKVSSAHSRAARSSASWSWRWRRSASRRRVMLREMQMPNGVSAPLPLRRAWMIASTQR